MKEGLIQVGGAVVFWKTGRSDRHALLTGMTALSLDSHVPQDRTPKAVLKDALNAAFCDDTRMMVRPTKNKDQFTVVREERGDGENTYLPVLTASVDDHGNLDVSPRHYEDDLAQAYRDMASQLPGTSVSLMLVRIVESLGGVSLRPHGAIYWLPATRLDKWSEVATVVEQCAIVPGDSALYTMRTAMDKDAVRAIHDSIAADIASELLKIENDLENGDLGERALQSRADMAVALRNRLQDYQIILGGGLEDVRERIDACEVAAATASVSAASKRMNLELVLS